MSVPAGPDELRLEVRCVARKGAILLQLDETLAGVSVFAQGIPLLRREDVARALRALADRLEGS